MEKLEERYRFLKEKKNLLTKLDEMIPWDVLTSELKMIERQPRKSNAGRKRYALKLMLKILILQSLYNLSDDELEYQINDRLSFMKFLGLEISDKIPDSKTIWNFREEIKSYGLEKKLFDKFGDYLGNCGYQAKEGQILDATMVPVPKQRNTRDENKLIKEGKTPEEWQENSYKLRQKDTEARWTKKGNISYYGYKNHVNTDKEFKLIRRYTVTEASVHDSQVIGKLLDDNNESDTVWADSAYWAEYIIQVLTWLGFDPKIHERAFKNKPLSEEQKSNNKEKSKIRARVEHIFGCIVMSMGGKFIRSIGIERAKVNIGLKNLTYNLNRYVFLESSQA